MDQGPRTYTLATRHFSGEARIERKVTQDAGGTYRSESAQAVIGQGRDGRHIADGAVFRQGTRIAWKGPPANAQGRFLAQCFRQIDIAHFRAHPVHAGT